MLSKSEIKAISKLLDKKYRKIERKFLAEGKRLISEGIKSNFICDRILLTQQYYDNNIAFVTNLKKIIENVDITKDKDFQKISSTKNTQGITAIFNIPQQKKDFSNDNFIIALENISDPGNLGTILRSCDWFGVNTVILSNGCAELYNPKVVRASMGAVFNLNIIDNIDLVTELDKLRKQNFRIYFADMSGIEFSKVSWKGKSVVTFCNEANGPTNELKQISDEAITIPKKGRIESLNVAAAVAVILSTIPIS